MTVTGVVFIPLLVALFAITLAALERRERRRQEAELDRLRALLAARNGHAGAPEWVWPAIPYEEDPDDRPDDRRRHHRSEPRPRPGVLGAAVHPPGGDPV